MRSSRDQEHFVLTERPITHPVVAALEAAFDCTIRHGLLSDDPATALRELSTEYSWIVPIASSATYRNVCDTVFNGGCAITPGFTLTTNIRDRFGFCDVRKLSGFQFHRGFSDSCARPGVLCQRAAELTYPRGNENICTTTGHRLRLPRGSFFVDADTYDEHMLGQSLLAVLP